MLFEFRKDKVTESLAVTAARLQSDVGLEAQSYLKTMEEHGNMYTFLERTLGKGITLVLGTDFAETSWTGLMSKGTSGKDHPIMATLKKSRAAVLAKDKGLIALRDRIVDFKMQEILDMAVGDLGLQTAQTDPCLTAPWHVNFDMGNVFV